MYLMYVSCHYVYRRDPFLWVMISHAGTFLSQEGQSSFTYIFGGKAIFTHHDLAWSRRTEAVYAQHVTVVTDIAMPAL